ncbi:hypothetical protein RchiOBHm_Chr4g0418631 [Rosa chinensis]|uniref:Uncharacterized protein n=1 Tax=Rosa chinensis TaxID=74649 RepID=A0A2P6QXG9_ROSCH|nr:hypothetical protein RchiOBHm_Chr4g0418631 [Rosa chinensis]
MGSGCRWSLGVQRRSLPVWICVQLAFPRDPYDPISHSFCSTENLHSPNNKLNTSRLSSIESDFDSLSLHAISALLQLSLGLMILKL